jgi:uncharacterized membrane protein
VEDGMTIVFPLHIVAAIVLVGGLFFASVVIRPIARDLDIETASALWQQMLSRFFVWGWISLLLILATGIGMVFLKFGGFSGVPMIHRGNMVVGIPAIVLFGYLFFGPWQRYRRTISRRDWNGAAKDIIRIRVVMGLILVLGLVASVVSAVGRYI